MLLDDLSVAVAVKTVKGRVVTSSPSRNQQTANDLIGSADDCTSPYQSVFTYHRPVLSSQCHNHMSSHIRQTQCGIVDIVLMWVH